MTLRKLIKAGTFFLIVEVTEDQLSSIHPVALTSAFGILGILVSIAGVVLSLMILFG